jgi:M6 family metalloprotease-like protein
VKAMEPYPGEYEIEQPDGSIIMARMAGSEDDPVEEDEDGFTIIGTGESGTNYEFGVLDDDGDITGSGVSAADKQHRPRGARTGLRRSRTASANMSLGGVGPSGRRKGGARAREGGGGGGSRGVAGGRGQRLGGRDLSSGLSEEDRQRKLRSLKFEDHIDNYEFWDEDVEDFHRRQLLQWSGTKKNLVIPLRFAGHASRWLPTKDQIDTLFNNNGEDATYAPTGSIKDVFLDSSYGKLSLDSVVTDWVPLSRTESYYSNGSRGFTSAMHEAMKEALIYLENTVKLDFTQFDSDGDGLIDSICFLHSGYAAEWGGNAEDGANYLDRIWSHKWSLYSFRHPANSRKTGWTSASGVRVYNYHISPAVYGTWPSKKTNVKDKMGRIGVIAHETGHFLGITDLYDKAGDGGNGLGSWGLMANSWGFDNNQWCIPIMSPWSKIQLGWLAPKEITSTGKYSIGASYDTEDVMKISTGYPVGEYLLLEYRKKQGFESCMPGEGMIIWHIDDSHDYDHQGWPGQAGWPANDKHYRISVAAADGLYELEKNLDRGDAGDLFVAGGVTSLGPAGTSAGKPYPNTDSYQGGNIVDTGIEIKNIGAGGGAKLSFDVVIPGTQDDAPVAAPTELICTASEKKLEIMIQTDIKGSQNTWEVIDVYQGSKVIGSGGPYPDGQGGVQHYDEYCLPKASCYKFVIKDSAGDGITGVGNGWEVTWGGAVESDAPVNAEFSTDGVDFGDFCRADGASLVSSAKFGNYYYYGQMFDMKAKKDIVIHRISHVHTSAVMEYNLKVYTKNGTYKGYEHDKTAWTLVQDQTITGTGFNRFTSTNNKNFWPRVPVMEGTSQAFYVVLDQPRLVFLYNAALTEGDVYATYNEFDITVGTYNAMNFGFAGHPSVFNGQFVIGSLKVAASGSDVSGSDVMEGGPMGMGAVMIDGSNYADDELLADEEPPELTEEVEAAIENATEETMNNGGPLSIDEAGLPMPPVGEESGGRRFKMRRQQ